MLEGKEQLKKENVHGGDIGEQLKLLKDEWKKKKNEKFIATIFLMKLYSIYVVTDT